jgi:hypothetical protein
MLSTKPSSSPHLYSQPLHSPSFSCAKTHCFPIPQLILCPLTHSLPPALTFPSDSPLTCQQTTPYSFILITHSTTYYTNFTQLKNPAIHNTNTLFYNKRNILKHTQ